jgi:hypothetical protein
MQFMVRGAMNSAPFAVVSDMQFSVPALAARVHLCTGHPGVSEVTKPYCPSETRPTRLCLLPPYPSLQTPYLYVVTPPMSQASALVHWQESSAAVL